MSRSIVEELPPLVQLLREDRRYKLEAYQFVRAGLSYAQDVLELGREVEAPAPPKGRPRKGQSQKGQPRPPHHVTGRELCLALKHLAHEQYGLLAKLVLASWGLRSTGDFGEIVYNLIKIGEMSKSASDRREDFDDVFDFDQALCREFAITTEE